MLETRVAQRVRIFLYRATAIRLASLPRILHHRSIASACSPVPAGLLQAAQRCPASERRSGEATDS
eukprot:scaffold3210_cov402-Prasinococcus_capsulatus_cf.AAC.10